MKTIKITIERVEDEYFSAYSDTDPVISGAGKTVEDCKNDILAGLETIKMFKGKNRPKWVDGQHTFTYKYDTTSLLSYYKGVFTAPALHRLTGINEKQIRDYATGFKKLRDAQKKKIESALHRLGEELLAVEL
jgi:hypothetical protein